MSSHPDAFKMGVFLNLIMLHADALCRSHRQNSTGPIDDDTAHAIAERAYAIVVHNFVFFDDDSGTLANAYEKPRATIVTHVAHTLVDATAAVTET
jgi:hypothetical protein